MAPQKNNVPMRSALQFPPTFRPPASQKAAQHSSNDYARDSTVNEFRNPSLASYALPASLIAPRPSSESAAGDPTVNETHDLSELEASCRDTAHSQSFVASRAHRGTFIGGPTDGGTCVISCRRSVDEEGNGTLAFRADFCEGLDFRGEDFDKFAQGLQTVFDDASLRIKRAMKDGASGFDTKNPKEPNYMAARKVATVLDSEYHNASVDKPIGGIAFFALPPDIVKQRLSLIPNESGEVILSLSETPSRLDWRGEVMKDMDMRKYRRPLATKTRETFLANIAQSDRVSKPVRSSIHWEWTQDKGGSFAVEERSPIAVAPRQRTKIPRSRSRKRNSSPSRAESANKRRPSDSPADPNVQSSLDTNQSPRRISPGAGSALPSTRQPVYTYDISHTRLPSYGSTLRVPGVSSLAGAPPNTGTGLLSSKFNPTDRSAGIMGGVESSQPHRSHHTSDRHDQTRFPTAVNTLVHPVLQGDFGSQSPTAQARSLEELSQSPHDQDADWRFIPFSLSQESPDLEIEAADIRTLFPGYQEIQK